MQATRERLDVAGAGAVGGAPRTWLRLEGAAVLVVALVLYSRADASWWLLAALFLLPDLSFAGYLAGARAGSVVYNVMHSYAGPLLAGLALLAAGGGAAVPLIWAAHVGFDRMLGYGLKYPTDFGDTHLGRIGGWP